MTTRRYFLKACLVVAGAGVAGSAPPGMDRAATAAVSAPAEDWKALFDGESLAGWRRTDFYGGGAVKVERRFRDGGPAIVIEPGFLLSGITWTDASVLPKTNYEIALEDQGRILAQAVKQMITGKVREAERDVLFEEFEKKIGEIVTGNVQRFEGDTVIVFPSAAISDGTRIKQR